MRKGWQLIFLVWILAGWSIWPVLSHPAAAFRYGGDDGIITWQINQTIQKIPNHLEDLFSGNIFYPDKYTGAFHMLLVPTAVMGYLPVKLTGNPAAAYNTGETVAQFLTVTVIFLWFYELTGDWWAAFAGTEAMAFSQIRWYFQIDLHMWAMQWMLFSLWMVWRYTRNQKVWQLYAAGGFLGLQIWESIYQAGWFWLAAVILVYPKLRLFKKDLKHLAIIGAGILLFISPVISVYWKIYKLYGFGGSIREAANFAMSGNDLWGKFLSPGLYIAFLICGYLVVKSQITNHKLQTKIFKGESKRFIILAVAGLVLALGPVLKWHDQTVKIFGRWFLPLPYGIIYYLIPGFSVLRSVHRFIWLTAFGMAGLISIWAAKIKSGRKWLVIGVLIPVVIAGGTGMPSMGRWPDVKDYPEVYKWLKLQSGQVILEYPVYLPADDRLQREAFRMVYSLWHGKKLIYGASGYLPPERGKLIGEIANNYPDGILDRKLKELGTNYVVVHKDETTREKLAVFDEDKDLKKVWEDPKSVVYAL